MRKVTLDNATPSVKKFAKSLRVGPDGIDVVLNGDVLFKAIPPNRLTEAQKDELFDQAWRTVQEIRERNRDVPARVIARDVRKAVADVRRRASR
jgi:hypothetical protein